MATETTVTDLSPPEDPREVRQERAFGTADLDGSGEATVSVTLSDTLHDLGMGLYGTVDVGDGSATLSSLTSDSVDVQITGGTANQENVEWELVVTEDGFYRDSGDTLSGGNAP